MNRLPFVSMMFRPLAVREVALGREKSAAVFANAVSGLFFVTAIFLSWLPLFTGQLVASLAILFGPLAGFITSSLYSRVEWEVSHWLGGKASRDELYRLFAWSFLSMGFAALLYALILIVLEEPSTVIQLLVAIPSLVIFFCSIRSYCANIIAVQQFSRIRGGINLFVSFVLFLLLVAGGGGILYLYLQYGLQDGMTELF